MNDFLNVSELFKKALTTSVNIAINAGERIQQVVTDLVEKGKAYQEKQQQKEDDDKETEASAESVQDKEEGENASETETTPKTSRWEEIEQRVRKVIESAIARFNFIRTDDHQNIEKRITALEEKLSVIAQQVTETPTDTEKRM